MVKIDLSEGTHESLVRGVQGDHEFVTNFNLREQFVKIRCVRDASMDNHDVSSLGQRCCKKHVLLHVFTIITNELNPCEGTISSHICLQTIFHCGIDNLHVCMRFSFTLVPSDPSYWKINTVVLGSKGNRLAWVLSKYRMEGHQQKQGHDSQATETCGLHESTQWGACIRHV